MKHTGKHTWKSPEEVQAKLDKMKRDRETEAPEDATSHRERLANIQAQEEAKR